MTNLKIHKQIKEKYGPNENDIIQMPSYCEAVVSHQKFTAELKEWLKIF